MAREETPIQIPRDKIDSAKFEVLLTTLASIYCLHDSLDYNRCKAEGLEGDALQSKLDLLTNFRKETIEEIKLDIIAILISKYG